jgi:serine protease Do
VKQGDVIMKVDGRALDQFHDLPRLIAESGIGKTVDLTVRRNGAEQQLQATLGKLKEEQVAERELGQQAQPARADALGLKLAPLDQRARQQLGLAKDVKGVVVADIAGDSPLAETGMRPGDVIVSINQQPVTKPAEAAKRLGEIGGNGTKHVLLLINRHGEQQFVGLSLEGGNQG